MRPNQSEPQILEVLKHAERPLSTLEIHSRTKTKFNPRTIRKSIQSLKKRGLIRQVPNLLDMRQILYMKVVKKELHV